jgi:hypothetical protein
MGEGGTRVRTNDSSWGADVLMLRFSEEIRCFEVTYCLHLQEFKVNLVSNLHTRVRRGVTEDIKKGKGKAIPITGSGGT